MNIILRLFVIQIFILNYGYLQTLKGVAPPRPTAASKVVPNVVKTTLKPNVQTLKSAAIPTTAASKIIPNVTTTTTLKPEITTPQFTYDIVTYIERTAEEPFIMNKKIRPYYENMIPPYFRQFGIFNCAFAFCENLEKGRKEFKKVLRNAGATISTCNKKLYYVPYANITAAETWQQCCQYGMVPATFTSREEFDCFIEAYNKGTGGIKKTRHGMFTAYMDANLDSRYISCHTMKSLPQNLWYRKEPDNEDWRQAVLGFSVFDEGFSDIFSQERLYVVCESVDSNITVIPQKISAKMFNSTNTNERYALPLVQNLWKLHIPHCKNAFCNREV